MVEADSSTPVVSNAQAKKLLEALAMQPFLGYCIIDQAYRIPDGISAPIKLTELGAKVKSELIAKWARTKPNDATVAVFSEFGCAAGPLVDDATDIEGLRRAVSREITMKRMFFPYIFGRELHDTAARMFPGKTRLSSSDTLQLLRALPAGVFQEGPFVSGPFGLLRSAVWRELTPRRRVPGYYCSRPTCMEVHSLALETSVTSASRARDHVGTLIRDRYSSTEDRNVSAISDEWKRAVGAYSLYGSASLFDLLSDGISNDELRRVVDVLLRQVFQVEPNRRAELSKQLALTIGNPSDVVSSLTAAHLLQIALLHTDGEVVAALDTAVEAGHIDIEPYELRLPMLSRFDSSVYEQRAELGALGARLADAHDGQLSARRLLELLHFLYFTGRVLEPDDLAYLLNTPPADENLLLDAALERPTREILEDVVLSGRVSANAAATFLGINPTVRRSQDDLLELMVWKLGMPPKLEFGELQRLRAQAEDVMSLLASGADTDSQRGALSVLFATFEDVLRRALLFSAWAYTADHYMAEQKFLYDPLTGDDALALLEKYAPASDPKSQLDSQGSSKSTIVPLVSAFARLAKALVTIEPDKFERPEAEFPDICRHTERPFALRHTVPFLDLHESSQNSVLAALRSVASIGADEVLVRVRNGSAHGNNPFPSPSEVAVAVERVNACADVLEEHGLFPKFYELSSESQDAEGRRVVEYRSGSSVVLLKHPRWGVATHMITSSPMVLIMPTSILRIGGPLRFSILARSGRDPYWRGYPRRWRTEMRYGAEEGADPTLIVEESAAG